MNMDCYWNNPDLTASVLRDNFILTNDLGYIDNEGFVYVLGRKDDVINYNGIKISPEEIEEVAIKYRGVKDAACVPCADKMAGQIPKLFISVEDKQSFEIKKLMNYFSDHLDGNKVPKIVEIIDEIPKTFNGKVKRRELMER
jgi:Acyl-CoA synthetases (AMP-forming)/AMP-acid ligases II